MCALNISSLWEQVVIKTPPRGVLITTISDKNKSDQNKGVSQHLKDTLGSANDLVRCSQSIKRRSTGFGQSHT